MAEIKQFKTFRDLKEISKEVAASAPSTTSISSSTSKPRTTSTSNKTKIPNRSEVSPIRDYQKIPNSITREAVPSGMFRGKSKLVYDLLWSKSRGKINPARTVNISRREIKKETAIGSMVTIDAALNHLQSIGLIQVIRAVGSLSGNQYEIFAPDELSNSPSTSSITSITSPTQKLDILDIPESSNTRETQIKENEGTYIAPKTLFKDIEEIDDDSPLYEAFSLLSGAAKRATGKSLTSADLRAFADFIKVFVNETDLAAGRASQVSSYVALGTENLKRRLYPKKAKGKSTGKKDQKDWQSVGKHRESDEAIEPEAVESLSDKARQNALVILRGILRDSTIEQIQPLAISYTSADWTWLMNELTK